MLWLLMLVALLPGMNVTNVTPPLPHGFAYHNGTATVLANCTPGNYTLHLTNGKTLNVTVLSPYAVLKELKRKEAIIEHLRQNVTSLKSEVESLKERLEKQNATIEKLLKKINTQCEEIAFLHSKVVNLTEINKKLLREKKEASWQATVGVCFSGLFAGGLAGVILKRYKA